MCAVEQRDFPLYHGRPVSGGGDPDRRGMAACSYEVRRVGVRSAMSAARARQRCSQAIFIRPRFAIYRRVSAEPQRIFRRYTNRIEPVALDEAYAPIKVVCDAAQAASTWVHIDGAFGLWAAACPSIAR